MTPTPVPVAFRRATGADAAEIADVWPASIAATLPFPQAHTDVGHQPDVGDRWAPDPPASDQP